MAARPDPSRSTSAVLASSGQGSPGPVASTARRSRAFRPRAVPVVAAAAAARSTRVPSPAGSASGASSTLPSRSSSPGPRRRSDAATLPLGPCSADSIRSHVSSLVQAMARAAAATLAISTSASRSPRAAATASCSCSRSRSDAFPVRRWSTIRTSSRVVEAAARAEWSSSRSMRRAHSAQFSECTSRSPPLPSFTSGSSRKATSPDCSWRSTTRAPSARSHRAGLACQDCRARVARSVASRSSPAISLVSSREVAVSRSSAANDTASFTVRMPWPSFSPASQSGYQTRSASCVVSLRFLPSWTRRTSRSLPGHRSPLP